MLGFVIAFRAKHKSKNWEEDCALLKNTLQSVCNQENRYFKVYLVYTDLPAIDLQPEVILLKFPFEFVEKNELLEAAIINDPSYKAENNKRIEFDYDKSKRIIFGCNVAKEDGCEFIMSVDADDLVSNKIAGFVNSHLSEKFGWFVDKGYICERNQKLLIKVVNGLSDINGSSNIVRARLIPVPDFSSKLVPDFAFFHWHSWLKYRLKEKYNETLKPLPFYGTIYILHDSSLSGYNKFLKKHFIKTILKYIIYGKRLTTKISNEFAVK